MTEETKSGHASTYLNKWERAAWLEYVEGSDMRPHETLKVLILETMVREGLLPQVDLDRVLDKIEYRKEHPHGNTKINPAHVRARARDGRARASAGAPDRAQTVEKMHGERTGAGARTSAGAHAGAGVRGRASTKIVTGVGDMEGSPESVKPRIARRRRRA